ncbi:MAG: LamG domain-containing protein [Sedimentisphaeraceae bacterium JB056]
MYLVLRRFQFTFLILFIAALTCHSSIASEVVWNFDNSTDCEGLCSVIAERNVDFAEGFGGKTAAKFGGESFLKVSLDELNIDNQLTIEALIKIEKSVDGIGNYIISACSSKAPDTLQYGLRLTDGCLQFVMRFKKAEGFSYKGVQTTASLPLDKWVYVCAVKSDSEMKLFVNGSLKATRTIDAHLLDADVLYIGQENSGSRLQRSLNGMIGELKLISSAESDRSIAQEYSEISSDFLGIKSVGKTHYFSFKVPEKDPRFPDGPSRLKLDFNYLEAVLGESINLDPETIKLVKWNKTDNLPLKEVDFRRTYDLQNSSAIIYWNTEQYFNFAVEISEYSFEQESLKQNIPMIGAGEPISVGSNDFYADLGQGLAGYPIVLDWDGDKDMDLIVSFVIPRRIFLFENIADDINCEPVFDAPVMIWQGKSLLTFDVSQEPDGGIYAFTVKKKNAGLLWESEQKPFIELQISKSVEEFGEAVLKDINSVKVFGLPAAANVFEISMQDINGDGVNDLVMGVLEGIWWWPDGLTPWNGGIGNPKVGYGKGYDKTNKWLGKPPIGSVYIAVNNGSNVSPQFTEAQLLKVDDEPITMPTTQMSPSFVDMNGDGSLDLLLAVGVDKILLYENFSKDKNTLKLTMPVNALKETAVSKWSYFDSRFEITDWDNDNNTDIIMCSNPGVVVKCSIDNGKLSEDKILKCRGGNLWADSLVVPSIADLNQDGKWDVITGDASGYLSYFANVGTNSEPLFASREKLYAGGREFHPIAAYSGSIQGPSEARWGYLAPNACDWDGDGDIDILTSDITGYVYWLCNMAEEKGEYKFSDPIALEVGSWPLKVRWRTRPCVIQGESSLNMITTDEDGYLALYERNPIMGKSNLKKAQRLLDEAGNEIKIDGPGGYNGRNKLYSIDWNRDGVMDIVCGQAGRSGISKNLKFDMPREPRATVAVLINSGSNDVPVYKTAQTLKLANGENIYFGTHSCAPAVYDFDGDGWDDLMIGEETGWVCCYNRSLFEDKSRFVNIPMDIE